ncbi:MAG: Mak10 subunit, NatC N-terminal acetyltransferase-domain-containing protein [Benjaminiella poitrasii]|nr:MAG: Mak10 subunit, NatC N-terminal acetyltransferase-domain-containing protein [Benjaminiella poitrasii]
MQQQPLGYLQEAFTDLNINMSTTEEEQQQECLLPQWKDITSFLDEATNDFDTGQLVHLQSFTLFDAMGAIEIMDPRMDTGMVVDQTLPRFDVQKRLTTEQTLGIMDRLVTCEMAWIAGNSLSQTVYTCIYFHHIDTLNKLTMPTLTSEMDDIVYGVLRTYILATMKCCQYIWAEMVHGNTYEEEDFISNLFGLNFDNQHSDVVIFNDLDASVLLLKHLLNTNTSDTHKKTIEALLNRIEIRTAYLVSLVYLAQAEGSHLSKAKVKLTEIVQLLDQVDLSVGQEYPEVFDPNINRKLTAQTPPRPIELASDTESFKEFGLLIKRLMSICTVTEYPSITSLMNFFLAFGSHRPYPDAFSRSKLNTLFFHQKRIFGKISVPQVILASIKETVQPPSWWLSPLVNHNLVPSEINPAEFMNAHDTLKAYLERISLVFVEFFKINCHNRSRQRRILCKMVSEWEILQEEAAGVDEVFHALLKDKDGNVLDTPYYFSSWAYNLKLTMIEKILFLGFELDLYGAHEYIMIYWYVQCVLGSRAYLLERIYNYADQSTTNDVYNYLSANQSLTHARKKLSEAMLKIFLVVKYSGQFDQRERVFDDEKTRYVHRFKPFAKLMSPPHPSYGMFLETVRVSDLDIPALLDIIKSDLTEAKKTLETVLTMSAEETNTEMCHDDFKEEIKNIVRTIVANSIGLNYIARSKDQENKPTVDVDFKYHPWFPIIKKM